MEIRVNSYGGGFGFWFSFPDLYLDTLDVLKYLPGRDKCFLCGERSCKDFVKKLKVKMKSLDLCPILEDDYKKCLKLMLEAEKILPKIPMCQTTVSTATGLSSVGNLIHHHQYL